MPRQNRNTPLPEAAHARVGDPLVQRAIDAIATSLIAVIKYLQPFVQQEKWKPLNYVSASNWADYADPALQVAQYRKTPLGRVELRGIVARSAGVVVTIAVLPVGYRPAKRKLFPVVGSAGAGLISIYASGVVEYTSGGTTYLSLEGVTFDTEP